MADHGNGKWSVERWLSVLTFVFVVGGGLLGAGAFISRMTAIEDQLRDVKSTLDRGTYVRSDVYTADQRALSRAIDALNDTLKQYVAWDQGRPTPRFERGK